MPTPEELFRDRAALDLALHDFISTFPVGLHCTMFTEPRAPRDAAALQRMRKLHPEIGELPTIMFRTGLAAGIIARELHMLLEGGGDDAVLRFTENGMIVVNGARGQMIQPAAAIVRILESELRPSIVVPSIVAKFLWRSFVQLMRTHYRRPTFFCLRVERNGSLRLLRPANATAQPTNA